MTKKTPCYLTPPSPYRMVWSEAAKKIIIMMIIIIIITIIILITSIVKRIIKIRL